MRRALILTGVLFAVPVRGRAHVFPLRSAPRVGATVAAAPDRLSILFDGEVEPALSRIEVVGPGNVSVDKKDSHVEAKDPNTLTVTLAPGLSSGEYRVTWTVLARDGHGTTGHFSFYVKVPKKHD